MRMLFPSKETIINKVK